MSLTGVSEILCNLITGHSRDVNYDESPTQILLDIESSKWQECVDRSETHPEEVRTWVYRLDSESKRERLWTALPIHAALLFQSPASVINAFLKSYPEGVRQRDGNDNLPIHIACRHIDPDNDVIRSLLENYPDSIYERNPNQGLSIADIDMNCPILYQLIESKEWNHAMKRIKHYPWEARTWIIKRDPLGIIKWRHLPLHFAVIQNAPIEVISYLLRGFPESAKFLDDRGNIPLELELAKPTQGEYMISALSKGMTYPDRAIAYTENDKHVLVDNDANCTVLYKLLKEKKWSDAINRIIIHPEETQVWVMRMDHEYGNGTMMWRHLPIHAALELCANRMVIEMLITANLDSIRACDDQGRIPFQLALLYYDKNSDVVKLLLETLENPEEICVRDPQGNVFLVNYDSGPQELYRLIEKQSWEECAEHAVEYPEEAKSWVMKKNIDGSLQWRRMPLHAALYLDCPCEVIESLLRAYPEGAKFRDDLGILPLQLARWRNCSEQIINAILGVFPEGDTMYDPTKTVVLDNSPTIKSKTTLTTEHLQESVEGSVSTLLNPTVFCVSTLLTTTIFCN